MICCGSTRHIELQRMMDKPFMRKNMLKKLSTSNIEPRDRGLPEVCTAGAIPAKSGAEKRRAYRE